jgi:hypothetical protein
MKAALTVLDAAILFMARTQVSRLADEGAEKRVGKRAL